MKKIAIIGSGGSGKTTLSLFLSKTLNIPVYHLDYYYWKPNWQETPHDEFVQKQMELMEQEKWIIEGNYLRSMSYRLFQADTIIFLDIPRLTCLWRVVLRQLKSYGKERKDISPGCIARFDKRFFQFLDFLWNYRKMFNSYTLSYLNLVSKDKAIFHLHSVPEINEFMMKIGK